MLSHDGSGKVELGALLRHVEHHAWQMAAHNDAEAVALQEIDAEMHATARTILTERSERGDCGKRGLAIVIF